MAKSNTKAAKRVPTRPAGKPGSRGGIYSWDTAGGGNPPSKIAPPPARAATPNYSTPTAMGAVTPIAAPPVVTQPFLTLGDQANQALEMSDVHKYLNDIDLSTQNARIDAQTKLGDIDTSEGRNLESADWDTAARGLAQSSIRDTTKANLSADAERARQGTKGALANQETYATTETGRVNKEVIPAIDKKWADVAGKNAQAKTDAEGVPADGGAAAPAAGPAAPSPAVAPTATGQVNQPTTGATGYKPVVKNGNFYHYYPATGKYVYIRPAGQGGYAGE